MLLWVSAEEGRREKGEEEDEWLRWHRSMAIYSHDPTVVIKREKGKEKRKDFDG